MCYCQLKRQSQSFAPIVFVYFTLFYFVHFPTLPRICRIMYSLRNSIGTRRSSRLSGIPENNEVNSFFRAIKFLSFFVPDDPARALNKSPNPD